MLETLPHTAFAQHVNTEFYIHDDPVKPVALKLTGVVERIKSRQQESFSLMFHGPAAQFIPQGIHNLEHTALGVGQLFLVPVGQDQNGFEYEAVFNHLVNA